MITQEHSLHTLGPSLSFSFFLWLLFLDGHSAKLPSDFADQFPSAEVIGTDLSPIQPTWVPPNLKFELDDATLTWSWKDDTFDFVHMRYLFGAITDWNKLLEEAYRCCKPGGWVQSCEVDALFVSDDGTTENVHGFETWNKLYREGGAKIGRSFTVVEEDLQRKAFEAAGFTDVQVVNYKVRRSPGREHPVSVITYILSSQLPIGGWPQDKRLSEAGQFSKLTLDNDMEGWFDFLHLMFQTCAFLGTRG